MSRWIDADATRDLLIRYITLTNGIDTALNDAPSIDIVRCKECKWADVCSQNVAMIETYDIYEGIEFCSYGERRE